MVGPRLGVTYRLDEKTVVRSGFGMTVDPDNFRYLRDSYPAVILQSYNGASSYNAAGCLNSGSYAPVGGCSTVGIPTATLPDLSLGTLALPASVSTNTVPQNFRRGYLYTYNLAFERQLPAYVVVTIAYVGTKEVRATSPLNINAGTVGNGQAGRPQNIAFGKTADIFVEALFGSVNYNGLQSQMRTQHYKSAQVGVIYTWSHAFDVSDNSTYGSILFADPAYYRRNYATSGYDRTNNLQVWGVFRSPFGKQGRFVQQGLAGMALGGWQLNTTISKVSGTPLTITASTTSLNAPGSTQVADQVKPTVAIYGAHNTGNVYFDTSAFAAVTAVRYGTSSRNSIRGPGYFTWNAGIFRSFSIWHESTFRFGVEAFDVTNTPGFSNPGVNISGSGFGQITGAFNNRTMRMSGKFAF